MARKGDEAFYKEIGKKIYLLRKEKGVIQKELAKLLNVTFQQLQKYEEGRNRIPLDCLIKICNTYKVDLISPYLDMKSIYEIGLSDLDFSSLITEINKQINKKNW